MSEVHSDFEPWPLDPLGTISRAAALDFLQRPLRDVAPRFCDFFGQSVFLVRKYVDWHYPIARPLFSSTGWIFDPSGPADQADLVELERSVGCTDYFRAFRQFTPPRHRLRRIERVLAWLDQTNVPRLSDMQHLGAQLAAPQDLTAADDLIAEAIVAALVSACSRTPGSAITFLPPRRGRETAEFRVIADGLSATLEVKHLLKVPQSVQEEVWLSAYRERTGPPCVRPGDRPQELVRASVQAQLATAPEKVTVRAEELPWQKRARFIAQQIEKADRQLGATKESGSRLIVLYSDDPHILTRSEHSPADEAPSENRIERAIVATLGGLRHADAIVLLASPDGFPIESGHYCRVFPRVGAASPEVATRLFAGLPELRPMIVLPFAMGAKVTLPPGGTDVLELMP